MSQTEKQNLPTHVISIKQKNPDQVLTGANCEILLDGKPLKGVTFLKLELKPNRIAKCTIEMVGSLGELECPMAVDLKS